MISKCWMVWELDVEGSLVEDWDLVAGYDAIHLSLVDTDLDTFDFIVGLIGGREEVVVHEATLYPWRRGVPRGVRAGGCGGHIYIRHRSDQPSAQREQGRTHIGP